MTFIHQDPEFPDLLRIVAEARQRLGDPHPLGVVRPMNRMEWNHLGAQIPAKEAPSRRFSGLVPWKAFVGMEGAPRFLIIEGGGAYGRATGRS